MVHDKLLAQNIRRILRDKGLKQYAVAVKADIPPRDLSAMLNGRKQFLSVHICPIANALNVTPNDLFYAPSTQQNVDAS